MSKKICKELKSITASLNLILSALEYNVSDTDLVAQELAERLEKAFTPMDIDESKRKEAVSCRKLPDIHIENRGAVTKVYVNGKELEGVRSIKFLHDKKKGSLPILMVELLAEEISIDTAQIFALPEVYHPFYVSSDKLVDLGILTYDQLDDLLEKKRL